MSDRLFACGRCRFFDDDLKECHRYAPKLITIARGGRAVLASKFPDIKPESWCGEHKSL